MAAWLAIAAATAMGLPSGAIPSRPRLPAHDLAGLAQDRAVDFRLAQEIGSGGTVPFLRSIVLQKQITSGATIGVGLPNLYRRRHNGGEFQPGSPARRSRKPAVTLSFRF